MGYADSHIHLTEIRSKGDTEGAELLFGCTARPSEWDMLAKSDDNRVVRFYGTHPWYCTENDTGSLERMLQEDEHACIGEIGIDAVRPDPEYQMKVFSEQLDIARRYDRPVNVHMVRCENEMLKILREKRVRCILHSFAGPVSYIRPFMECGCYFSISPRLLRRSKEKTMVLLRAIPDDRLLIETDAPNNDIPMGDLIGRLSELMSVQVDDLVRLTSRNARTLIP